MKKLIIFGAFILSLMGTTCVFGQTPLNLIPNAGFETGTFPSVVPCHNRMKDISDWKELYGSPSWRSKTLSDGCTMRFDCPTYQLDGDKYIFLGKDGDEPDGEAVISRLTSTLEKGKRYKFRIWGTGEPAHYFTVHLVKRDDKDWGTASETMKFVVIGTVPFYNLTQSRICNAFVFENIITVNKEDLKHIVLADFNGPDNKCFVFLDNIELYEYCTENVIRQARIYKHPTELEEANYITAGSVVNNGPAMGDIQMLAGSITTYKANTEVDLVEGFNVERNADFTAKIAQC